MIKKEIIINSNIKKVWKTFSQLEKWPIWGGYILNAKWISERKWTKGSKFTQVIEGFWFFKSFKSNPEVIEIKPLHKVTWHGSRKYMQGVHTFIFEKKKRRSRAFQ